MNSELRKKLGVIGEIPTMPHIATKVMNLVADPNTSSKDINDVISLDERISAKVLKMANSAFFGCMSSIKTVKQAIVIIGFSTVRSLVVACSTSSLYKKDGQNDEISKKLWEHSVGCSFASRLVSKKTGYPDIDEAFTGGLLHDIGRVIIHHKFSEEFLQVIEKANNEKIDFQLSEKQVLGFDHSEVGLFLSEKWKLPLVLKDIICYHHDPAKSTANKDIVAIVTLADKICIKKGIGIQTNEELNLEDSDSAKILGLKNTDLDPLIEKFMDTLKNEMSILNLE